MMTTETLRLLLSKLPEKARRAYRVPNIAHNLIAVAALCDAGCEVRFYKHGVDIEYEGEIIYRGWRDMTSRLWRVLLTSEGGQQIQPETSPEEYDPSEGAILQASVNAIYECENKEQLIKYYHAALGSHTKTTLTAAANRGYLRGFPGLQAEGISKFIGVETATEMGHMKQRQKGVQSTTTKSNRGRPSTSEQERESATEESIEIPAQEDGNKKTHLVYMTTTRPEGYVASDQTGRFPHRST